MANVATGTARTAASKEDVPAGEQMPVTKRARRLASGPAIRDAAARLFLERSYAGTSMDDIAATAHVSKQTIYTHFADKETLFADLVLRNTDRVEDFVQGMLQVVRDATDGRAALHELARRYIYLVSSPDVLRLRRLVIGESGRFPDLARAYYDQVPERVYSALADVMRDLTDRGELHAPDPALAAQQFAWLVIGVPIDRGMFLGTDDALPDADLDRIADAAVTTFLAAYTRQTDKRVL